MTQQYRDLLAAAKTGAQWMRWWLDQDECECEYGHSCGKIERTAELKEIERAITAAKLELVNEETYAR